MDERYRHFNFDPVSTPKGQGSSSGYNTSFLISLEEVYLPILAILFALLVLYIIYRLSVSYIRRKRDREWEQRLQFLADHLAQRLEPLQTKSVVLAHRVPEIAGWRGLRYGTGLGFGTGLAVWFGIAKRSGVETMVAVLTVWWVLWSGQGSHQRAPQGVLVYQEDIEVLEIEATVFGVVLGAGLAFSVSAGLSFHWPLEWTVVLCLVWVLSWATWEWQARRISFRCIQVGGFRWRYLSGVTGFVTRSLGLLWQVIRHLVVGFLWMLTRLFGSLLFANGSTEQELGLGSGEGRNPGQQNKSDKSNSSPSPAPSLGISAPNLQQEDPATQLTGVAQDVSPPIAPLQEEEQPSRRRTRGKP